MTPSMYSERLCFFFRDRICEAPYVLYDQYILPALHWTVTVLRHLDFKRIVALFRMCHWSEIN